MKKKAWAITGIACGSLIFLLAGTKYFEISSAMAYVESMPEYSETVATVNAEHGIFSKPIEVLGNTVAPSSVVLHNELSGVVSEVNHLSGSFVTKGDVIVQLDVAKEMAQIESATVRHNLASSIYQRAKKLHKNDALSQEQFDRAHTDLIVIKSEIAVLKDTIRKKTIRAPFDGIIGIHTIKKGMFIAGNSNIVSISAELGYVWVDFYIPQFYPKLELNTEVTVNGINHYQNNEQLIGTVMAIDDSITEGIRSRKYRVRVNTANHTLDTNTAVAVTVHVGKPTDVAILPNIAVLSDLAGNYVYKLKADESGALRAFRQNVSVVSSDEQRTMISNGVDSQDTIVAGGSFKLFEGVLVKVATNDLAKASANSLANEG